MNANPRTPISKSDGMQFESYPISVGDRIDLRFASGASADINGSVVAIAWDAKVGRRLAIVESDVPVLLDFKKDLKKWFCVVDFPRGLEPTSTEDWPSNALGVLAEPWHGQELYDHGPIESVHRGDFLHFNGQRHFTMIAGKSMAPQWAVRTDTTILRTLNDASRETCRAAVRDIVAKPHRPEHKLEAPYPDWEVGQQIYDFFEGFELGRTFLVVDDSTESRIGSVGSMLDWYGWNDPGQDKRVFVWDQTETYKLIHIVQTMMAASWPNLAINEYGMLMQVGALESRPEGHFGTYRRYKVNAQSLFELIDSSNIEDQEPSSQC